MNYDPNLTFCGRKAIQKVLITFASFEYSTIIETEVYGNLLGLNVIECAIENIYDTLEDDGEFKYIILKDEEGDILEIIDEENRGEDWLKDLAIKAEIISIEEHSTF